MDGPRERSRLHAEKCGEEESCRRESNLEHAMRERVERSNVPFRTLFPFWPYAAVLQKEQAGEFRAKRAPDRFAYLQRISETNQSPRVFSYWFGFYELELLKEELLSRESRSGRTGFPLLLRGFSPVRASP
jgi:hypothetical protein